MTTQLLERELVVPGSLEAVFAFFKDPHNLSELTPRWLNFQVRAASDPTVRNGTRIQYRIRWLGLPMRWESVIEEYVEGAHFADRMLVGPYARWLHRHAFRAVPGGVLVADRVEYALPLGWAGALAHRVMVRRQLEAIFDFRTAALARRFGVAP
ncbi:MAG: SRPBCC family protein [Gemmatimonadota bacterium]